jgi:type VI secretion system secreted protein Hcp
MEDVLVADLQHGGAIQQDRVTEQVSLNFARVTFTYVPQKADGTGDAEVKSGYNIAKNVKM